MVNKNTLEEEQALIVSAIKIANKNNQALRLSNVNKFIWVTFQKSGIHYYPAAADDPALEKVSYLASPHRHIFHFKVQISVNSNDRDIEFILFKQWLESFYDDKILKLDYRSCEMMCEDLFIQIEERYPSRDVIIDISEDGENGAHMEFIQ
jgi:hypothetical protein